MNLDKISSTIQKIFTGYAKKFEIKTDSDYFLLKIQEEVGELSSAHLKLSGRGRKKKKTDGELKENLRHEIADVIAMTLLYAKDQGVDVEEAIQEKWFQYLEKKD